MDKCSVEKCSNKSARRGYCHTHYKEALRSGELPYKWPKKNHNNASKHLLYPRYQAMKERCLKPYNKEYHLYGGRGIKICERWLGEDGFWNFVKDMGECPLGYSLDRVDVNGNYCPENCRWASSKLQANNKRNNLRVEGVTVSELAERYPLQRSLIQKWVKDGKSLQEIQKAFASKTPTPNGRAVQCIETGEKYKSIKEAAIVAGVSPSTLSIALNHGEGVCGRPKLTWRRAEWA